MLANRTVGALPSDHAILREINSLIAQLPSSQPKETQESTKATSNLLYRVSFLVSLSHFFAAVVPNLPFSRNSTMFFWEAIFLA